jgi:polyketide cyclase/dehydrase/lipid transport protein
MTSTVTDAGPSLDHSCTEVVVINRNKPDVYRALHDVREWPRHLPHVLEIDVRYDDGRYQEFFMTVSSADPRLRVRSVRNCRTDLIEFFQPEPPVFLRHHAGSWRLRSLPDGACEVVATHAWTLAPREAAASFPDTPAATTAQRVRGLLAEHSRLALTTWRRVLETSAAP